MKGCLFVALNIFAHKYYTVTKFHLEILLNYSLFRMELISWMKKYYGSTLSNGKPINSLVR